MAGTPEITEPVRVDQESLTHNVYPGPSGAADNDSQKEFSQYVVDRMYGADDKVAQDYRPGAEVPGQTHWRREGWVLGVTPGKALIATAVGLVVLNVAVNAGSMAGKIKEMFGDLKHQISPEKRTVLGEMTVTQSRTHTLRYPLDLTGREHRSGTAQEDRLSARKLVLSLKALKSGSKVEEITIVGNTSDEWAANGPKSVGRNDTENNTLGLRRAVIFGKSVDRESQKLKVSLPDARTSSEEHILDNSELSEVLLSVQKSKYGSVLEAISAYNAGDKSMSPTLATIIKETIAQNRVSTAIVKVRENSIVPAKVIVESPHEESVDRPDDKHPIKKIPFLIPFFPRMRREHKDPFRKPPIIRDEPIDKVWVELYEEALKTGGKLVDDAWSLSRKYQYLYRENRITQVLQFDYVDDSGKKQKTNVLFTDRDELGEDVIDAISGLLLDISMMQNGKVAEKLDTIVVVPTEQTGPQRPDKIGLGIDDQMHQNVLGVAIPVLGLVELHMPDTPTKGDIERFNGTRWVIAHEVGGHFTDVNKQSRIIDKTKSNRPGRIFTARNPWVNVGADSYNSTSRRGVVKIQQFTIPNPDGSTTEFIVNAGDQELVDAPKARLRGEAPTNYGDTSAAEIHAETAAGVITGIPIPASESGNVPEILGDKAGYKVDAGLQHRFISRIGALRGKEDLEWDPNRFEKRQKTVKVSVLRGAVELNDDKDQNRISENAKNSPYQDDEKRLKILARVRR